jgi:hypothetical protein
MNSDLTVLIIICLFGVLGAAFSGSELKNYKINKSKKSLFAFLFFLIGFFSMLLILISTENKHQNLFKENWYFPTFLFFLTFIDSVTKGILINSVSRSIDYLENILVSLTKSLGRVFIGILIMSGIISILFFIIKLIKFIWYF